MAAKRVAFSTAALNDLYNIEATIELDNPGAATRVIQRIHTMIGLLAEHPRLGAANREGPGYILVEPRYKYVIAYQIEADRIEIRYVFHPAQDRSGK